MSTLYLTRLVIETQAPMAINSGGRETGFDSQLARDANGLPYIPGTSIAGVWRSLAKAQGLDIDCWFGITEKRSILMISDGIVHDSNNQPVMGLRSEQQINQDKLLALLYQHRPHHRERVRINDRGVAADAAKFDQLLLPAGVRFSIDIQWRDDDMAADKLAQWQTLLQCWFNRLFALGATTRNGLGRIKVIASAQQQLNLTANPQAATTLRNFMLKQTLPITLDIEAPPLAKPFVTMPLQAMDNWRCGSGTALLDQDNAGQTVAMISYSEKAVNWEENQAKVDEPAKPILCGSSIKGILAHRVAFHYRRLNGEWAAQMADSSHGEWQAMPEALRQLFGYADPVEQNNSLAGRLIVDDCAIVFDKAVLRQHTSIDRFTGGVRQGALFNEELLYQPRFELKLWLVANTVLDDKVKAALVYTLEDLAAGLLPFGAGSGRGTSLVSLPADRQWTMGEIA